MKIVIAAYRVGHLVVHILVSALVNLSKSGISENIAYKTVSMQSYLKCGIDQYYLLSLKLVIHKQVVIHFSAKYKHGHKQTNYRPIQTNYRNSYLGIRYRLPTLSTTLSDLYCL